jgi:hypothetical protein
MAGYNPLQSRDWHGRWARGDGGAGLLLNAAAPGSFTDPNDGASPAEPEPEPVFAILDDGTVAAVDPRAEVVFPPPTPGEKRNDEIASLLEWIANATPKDERDIRAEIERMFTKHGDLSGAAVLHGTLRKVLRTNPSRDEREALLRQLEPFTHRDPVHVGDLAAALAFLPFLKLPFSRRPPLPPRSSRPQPPVRRPPSADTEDVEEPEAPDRHPYWYVGWARRGLLIEKLYGGNLPPGFPTIDKFTEADGVATSIKSIGLMSKSYMHGTALYRVLNNHVDALAAFKGVVRPEKVISEEQIKQRELLVVVPLNTGTGNQRQVIKKVAERAAKLGVTVRISQF